MTSAHVSRGIPQWWMVLVAAGVAACSAQQTPTASVPTVAQETVQLPAAQVVVESSDDTAGLPEHIRSAILALDRTPEDRALDAARKPGRILEFFKIEPGMRVAELGAGYGYMTELLARSVGASGVVYAQNSKILLEKFGGEPLAQRLARPLLQNVHRVDREFDDPLPPEARNLDAVINVLFYHDTVWMKSDRNRMNRAIFAALRPGGIYGIVDHSARGGAGAGDAPTLHRIEEKLVVDEVQQAGFKLDASADFLRHASDTRDWNTARRAAAEKRGTSDRFVLRFVKPK